MIDELMARIRALEREVARLNAQERGFQPAGLAAPLTSTSWDGDSFSTVSTATELNMVSVFGCPSGIKAVKVRMYAKDSATHPQTGLYFALGPSSTYWYCALVRPVGDDVPIEQTTWINVDANGSLWYKVAASGTGTLDIVLQVWDWAK
jgi:hypothetical protein